MIISSLLPSLRTNNSFYLYTAKKTRYFSNLSLSSIVLKYIVSTMYYHLCIYENNILSLKFKQYLYCITVLHMQYIDTIYHNRLTLVPIHIPTRYIVHTIHRTYNLQRAIFPSFVNDPEYFMYLQLYFYFTLFTYKLLCTYFIF